MVSGSVGGLFGRWMGGPLGCRGAVVATVSGSVGGPLGVVDGPRSRGLTRGRPSLKARTNRRSPAGGNRCSTLITWVAVGSPGIQCGGVRDQSKETCAG
jgi:hypothetical protein